MTGQWKNATRARFQLPGEAHSQSPTLKRLDGSHPRFTLFLQSKLH